MDYDPEDVWRLVATALDVAKQAAVLADNPYVNSCIHAADVCISKRTPEARDAAWRAGGELIDYQWPSWIAFAAAAMAEGAPRIAAYDAQRAVTEAAKYIEGVADRAQSIARYVAEQVQEILQTVRST